MLEDIIKSISIDDFRIALMYPCVRSSLITGIYGGLAIGVSRFVMTPFHKPSPRFHSATNYAVLGFAVCATLSREYCVYKRKPKT